MEVMKTSSANQVQVQQPDEQQVFEVDAANFLGNQGRKMYNPYSNTYNPGWKNHPNFSWKAADSTANTSKPVEKKPSFEEIMMKYVAGTEIRLQNQEAMLQKLETQMSQIATQLSTRPAGSLPSNTERNPKDVNAILVVTRLQADTVEKNTEDEEASELSKEKGLEEVPKQSDSTPTGKKVNFVVLDMEEDREIPLILSRPFLATGKALIDVHKGDLMLRMNDEKVIFNVFQGIRYPVDDSDCFRIDITDDLVEYSVQEQLSMDPLEICLTGCEEEKLLRVIREHIRAIGWSLADIKGISPTMCMHKILMEAEHKTSTQPQRQLNSAMQERCEESNLVLNWEKCHFMVKEGIVLGHKMSEVGVEVDRAKLEVIEKLPPPTNLKGIRSFLGHAAAQLNYATTEKELLAVVFALDKFRSYLVGSKVIVHTDHLALKYLMRKKDAKPRKGAENQVADHLSRLENQGAETQVIHDDFPDE
ncbi:uncharacterized protein [Henckelia pumila]|uniref:uncharacterized protein n=1 Tax=Henckelia pumila TaxID=405737 RepID=UPI003C6E8B9B